MRGSCYQRCVDFKSCYQRCVDFKSCYEGNTGISNISVYNVKMHLGSYLTDKFCSSLLTDATTHILSIVIHMARASVEEEGVSCLNLYTGDIVSLKHVTGLWKYAWQRDSQMGWGSYHYKFSVPPSQAGVREHSPGVP
ncbi:hypothetical protein J6590_067468 [Homalodisca vitripennis]|nr:hypothetical protein J6590_067468 [Homalodisca vitripennis]